MGRRKAAAARTVIGLKAGDSVTVSAFKADGTRYRRWHGTVEAVEADRVVVVTLPGHQVEGLEGTWSVPYAIRGIYWLDRCYSLLEVYTADGALSEIYVNIASPATVRASHIRFTDYELDVTWKPTGEARILDEDEFAEAASRYQYSAQHQEACYRAAREALVVAQHWQAGGMPLPAG